MIPIIDFFVRGFSGDEGLLCESFATLVSTSLRTFVTLFQKFFVSDECAGDFLSV